jgi:intracellular septation protein
LAFGQLLLKIVFEDAFRITDEGWRVLTIRWALFFLFLAGLNELVWRTQTNEFWISFKIWGVLPLSMIFAVAQIGLIKRYEAGAEA